LLITTRWQEAARRWHDTMSMDRTALAKPCVWRRFLESLLARGLHGVKLIVADDHAGLKAARRAVLPSVPWQRGRMG